MTALVRRFTPRTLRNWIRQPRRTARYVLDRMAYACGSCESVVIRPDWPVRCHPASREHFEVFRTDPVQRAELDLFVRHCKPGMEFLDVGAHHGLFALAVHQFSNGARTVCVEASPKAAHILQANLNANDAHSASLLNVAAGQTDGSLEMLSTGPAGSDYFVSVPAGRSDTISVRQLSLASILRETGLRPTHLKIDVEGFEDDVIAGGLTLFKELQPIVFLELHGCYLRARQRDPTSVIRALHECGYQRIEDQGYPVSNEAIAARGFEGRFVCFPAGAA